MASLYREHHTNTGFFCGAKVCSASHQCVHTAAAWHMWNERVMESHFLPVLCQFNQEPLTEAFAQCILMHDGIAGMAPPHRVETHALQGVWETRIKTSSLSNRVSQIQTTDKCNNYNIQKQRSQKTSQNSNTGNKQEGWHQMDSAQPRLALKSSFIWLLWKEPLCAWSQCLGPRGSCMQVFKQLCRDHCPQKQGTGLLYFCFILHAPR